MTAAPYNYSYIFKYIIIGDMGVGKSCLLHQFTEKKFMADCPHTIGVEFGTRIMEVHSQKVKLQIWDTAGQERFRARDVTYEEAKQFAEENGEIWSSNLCFLFLLRSAVSRSENVEEAFLEAAKKIYQNIQDGSLDLNAAESGVQHKPSAPQGGRLNADSQPAKEGCSC
uniref:RAB14, member RAS oncogene family, like n=1 Tax=Nothobranchius furzeri TaxID=105023 RepID=A0A8C6KWS5_NOTFU